MSKNNENKIVPKFRFPEFINDGEWKSNVLGNVYNFITTNSFSRDDLNYASGNVKNIHYGDIHTKFSTLFDITKENVPFINENIQLDKFKKQNYCKEGDMIFADASEDLKDVGKGIEVVNLNNEKLLSGLHTLQARQINSDLAIGFGGYLFLNDRIRKQIQRESQGAKVLGISATRLSNINIFFPKNKTEQQKIAACLSSLDEVITAENQKLEVLKDHKKGLLQNLLPQAEETVPKFRFKEFENSGEWVENKLGEVVVFSSGGTPSKDNYDYWNGHIPWISASSMHNHLIETSELNVTELAISNGTKIAKKGSLLVLVRGSMLYKRVPICISLRDVAFNQDVKALELKKDINNLFLLYLLYAYEPILLELVSATGIGAGKLDTEDLKKLTIFIPNLEEQQKIASTLSSIDDLINAQNQKLEALQLHKKGLLQGLFPNVNE